MVVSWLSSLSTRVVVVFVAVLAVGLVWAAPTPASAAGPVRALIAADDPATGDPQAPDDAPVPEGLDETPLVPDETIEEFLPSGPGIVSGANTEKIAWIGTPADRPDDAALTTLQVALAAAPAGGIVSIIPGQYAFTGALLATQAVTIDSATESTIFGRFTVSGGGLALADDVWIGVAATGAAVSVTASGAQLSGITVRNPNAVARPTGIQVGAGISGVAIDGFTMDGGEQVSSYGVNLTSGSAAITDAEITGVAVGVTVTAAASPSGVVVTGGHITAATTGVSLGTATAPQITGVRVTGNSATGTGIDLAGSAGATVSDVLVEGFNRGIATSTINASAGPTISDVTIVDTAREGIALGATTAPHVLRPTITGSSSLQSTGILLLRSTGAIVEEPTIAGMMYGVTTHLDNTGAGPVITAPRITAFGAITLGSTQGARVSDAVLDTGAWGDAGTGINLVNAGRVTITNEIATGFLYAVGSQSSMNDASDRVDLTIDDITVVGAPEASHGVYLLGAEDAAITHVDADITGAALVIHQSVGITAQNIVVHGHEGLTSTTGASILRAYGSSDVNVDTASIDAGSYGFFYSATDGSTVTNASVSGVVERAIYGRSVADLDVSDSTFTGNAAVGVLVVTTPANGISHDIAIHDNTMTDNRGGLEVLQGTTSVSFERNTVSGQPNAVTAGGAVDLLIADNTIEQTDDAVAIAVAPLWEDGAVPGSYSSSDIRIQRNTFGGSGTWIAVGTADPESPAAERRTLRDPVLVTGNTFPAASTAVHTYPNAVQGADVDTTAARALPIEGPIAVDARDYDDPNDWGAQCRASGYVDGASYYAGGGASVYELTNAPVLYPMNCIDLSLTQMAGETAPSPVREGDVVTWTLTPHNEGPRAAPSGWTITQLLPASLELVSMSGNGYLVSGSIATAVGDLPAGESGPVLTVSVRVLTPPDVTTALHDVAYIAPAPLADLDEDGGIDEIIEATNPLVIPTIDTDTDASATDNDAQGTWAFAAPNEGDDTPTTAGGIPRTGGAVPFEVLAWGCVLLAAGVLLTRARATRPRR